MTTTAHDTVDPTTVPRLTLAGGATIPMLGLGTFGSGNDAATRGVP